MEGDARDTVRHAAASGAGGPLAGGGASPGDLVVTFPATADAPMRARQVAGRALERWLPQRRDVALLVVSELITNAIMHGATSIDDVVALRIHRAARTTRIEVTDPGVLWPDDRARLDALARGTLPAAGDRRRSGWGLPIVSELSDRWGVIRTARRTCVWCELDGP